MRCPLGEDLAQGQVRTGQKLASCESRRQSSSVSGLIFSRRYRKPHGLGRVMERGDKPSSTKEGLRLWAAACPRTRTPRLRARTHVCARGAWQLHRRMNDLQASEAPPWTSAT